MDRRPALNALRGFAALWVVVYHLRYFSTFPWFDLGPSVSFGYMGVDFFFVLSGLIISHVYLVPMMTGRAGYIRFLWLRIARLWPVHALMMMALLAAAAPVDTARFADWLSLTFLVRQWLMPDGYAWNHPAWSVSAEIFAHAFVFPCAVAAARGRSWTRSGILLSLSGLATLLTLYAAAGTLNVVSGPGPLMRVTGGFLLGSGLYCLLRAASTGPRWDWAVLGSVPVLAAGLAARAELLALMALALAAVGAYMTTGPVGRRLSSKPLHALGEVSFSLYLAHVPVLTLLAHLADTMAIGRGLAFSLSSVGLCLFVAVALHGLIEVPARTWLRSLSSGQKKAREVPEPV